MAAIWDDGTTASSDGHYFRAGGRAGPGGVVNVKYVIDPGVVLIPRARQTMHSTPAICWAFASHPGSRT